jgi:amidohydrolase
VDEQRLGELKARVCAAADARRDDIIRIGQAIWERPEAGFKEFATAALVADEFRALGLEPREGLAITGVRADLPMAGDGPTIAILGELDGLPVPDHPAADPSTGAVHACGHNTQIAHMLGVGMALGDADVAPALAGRVALVAVPAEEYVELEWRGEQMRAGRIEFLGGKPELVRLGHLDDVDMAMLVHASTSPEGRHLLAPASSNGMLAKRIRFVGRAAHAAAAPHQAVNALNAATLALAAINFQRETFREQDTVRVHPIITKGGDTVNVVPAEVRIETFVRGATLEAIRDAEAKVDRSLRAGAMAIGARVEIDTIPGYLPLVQNPDLMQLFARNAVDLVGPDRWAEVGPTKASTDAGDLSQIMPLLHPSAAGFSGTTHGADFQIVDPELAYINPVKAMAMTVVDLLADNARAASEVCCDFTPRLTQRAYLEFMRGLSRMETYPS